MLDVHYWPTPNGKKVTILLEELGLPYKIVPCDIGKGDQFTNAFLKMNPNHRMPVLVAPARAAPSIFASTIRDHEDEEEGGDDDEAEK